MKAKMREPKVMTVLPGGSRIRKQQYLWSSSHSLDEIFGNTVA